MILPLLKGNFIILAGMMKHPMKKIEKKQIFSIFYLVKNRGCVIVR